MKKQIYWEVECYSGTLNNYKKKLRQSNLKLTTFVDNFVKTK